MDKHRIAIRITPGAYFSAAISIMLIPCHWLISACVAAMIHELAHLAALKLCRIQVCDITIGGMGAKIRTEPMPEKKEIICAAAGPVASLSLVLLSEFAPLVGLFAFFHGICNLLPVFPLDGGRFLNACLQLIIPKYALTVMQTVQIGMLSFLAATGLYFFLQPGHRKMFLLAAVILILRMIKEIACKQGQLRVQ